MPETVKPNYYAVIPAEVRYAQINPAAKLFYAEITALATKKGYCWATNAYFADLYQTSERTITRWLEELVKFGFCRVDKNVQGGRQICLGGVDKFVQNPTDMTREPSTIVSIKSNNENDANASRLSLSELATALGRGGSRPTVARVTKLRARLKTYSLEELTKAARAIAANDFMVKGGHNTLDYLLRNDEKVERWLNINSQVPSRGYL